MAHDDIDPGEREKLRQASRAAKLAVDQAARESVEQIQERNKRENARLHGCPNCAAGKCFISCPRYLTHYASQAEFWSWWARTSPAKQIR